VGLLELFDRFRKTPWFRILYMGVFGVIVGFLIPIAGALGCLLVLGIGIGLFGMPYLVGERSIRRMFLYVLLVVVIAVPIAAAPVSDLYASFPQEFAASSSGSFVLSNGTVEPYDSGGAGDFTFHVDVRSLNATYETPDSIRVFALVIDVTPFEVTQTYLPLGDWNGSSLSAGTRYTGNYTVVGYGLHYHRFEVFQRTIVQPATQCPPPSGARTYEEGRSGCFLAGAPLTSQGGGTIYGPIALSGGGIYGMFVVRSLLFMLFPVFTFGLIALMFWWTRRAREVREKRETRMTDAIQAAGGEFTCSNCGTDVPGAAVKCPKCGASFDEPEAEIKPETAGAPEKEPGTASILKEEKPAGKPEASRRPRP